MILAAAGLVLGALWCAPAGAQQAVAATGVEPFTVRNVMVDRTGATAAAARDGALLDGQRLAFRRLIERLTLRAERRPPTVADARIGDLVENFEVQNERTSSVRYIATLTYRFRAVDVRTLLRNANVPFAETAAKPYLVLPVLRLAGLTLLWDGPNRWRAAWGRLPPTDGLAPLILPRGDLADISAINADQALRGDDTRLGAMTNRYNTAGVLVANASLETGSNGRSTVQVSLSRYGGAAGEQTVLDSYVAETNEDDDALLQRAAAATVIGVEERWKSEQVLRFGREAKMTVAVTFDDIADWAAIRGRLAELAVVRGSTVTRMSHGEAVVDLAYISDETQLRLSLAQRDLTLTADSAPGASAPWRLSMIPARRAGGRAQSQ